MTSDFSAEALASVSVMELQKQGAAKWMRNPGALGASVAEMDFPIAAEIRDALRRAAKEGPYGYMPEPLNQDVAAALVELLNEDTGWEPDVDHVVNMADILLGLEASLLITTEPGDAITVMTPAYMPFLTSPGLLNRRILEAPLTNTGSRWAIDWTALEESFRRGSRFLILCNPHNPLGKVYSAEELAGIALLADQYGVQVFSDEVHALIRYDNAKHVPFATIDAASAQSCITATSASKAWNIPGLKCAQLVFSDAQHRHALNSVPRSMLKGVSTFGAIATLIAYRAGSAWFADVVAYLDENRRHVDTHIKEQLPGVDAQLPEATYLTWLDCRDLEWGDSPSKVFLDRGNVALTDGALCGTAGFGYARLNFATPRHILDQILEGLTQSVATSQNLVLP